jgi:hypothetical protein
MEVNINEITSTVRAVDGEALLAPATLQKIVQIVLEAVRAEEAHRARVQAEQQVTQGVRASYTGGMGG